MNSLGLFGEAITRTFIGVNEHFSDSKLSDPVGGSVPRTIFVGMPPEKAGVPWYLTIFDTKSLFDIDVVVADMRRVLGEYSPLMVPPTEVMERKVFEAERLLAKGGIIVCLLSFPETHSFFSLKAGSFDWIPIKGLENIVLKGEGDQVIKTKSSPFDDYLALNGVTWYAYLAESSRVKYETLAKNEGDLAIAARIESGKGSIYLLPFCLGNKDWLKVLHQCIGKAWTKEEHREPPSWVNQVSVPGEKEMVSKLEGLDLKIKRLVEETGALSRSLNQKLEVKKLLYEQGLPLEKAVQLAFQELGYSLEREGDKDLAYKGPSSKIIFEVTGSAGPIDLGKLRQLLEFVNGEEKKSGKTPTGVLLGNNEMDTPPKERGTPFTKHVLDGAKPFGICLLPTIELFNAVISFRESKLDPKKFLDDLVSTIGVFHLAIPTEPIAPTSSA